jgi:anti-anti-sigma regulatory factor
MDFSLEHSDDIFIIKVIVRRATFLEALQFRDLLIKEADNGRKKFVVDLSECTSIDSAFFSAIIIAYRKITSFGGKMKLVNPKRYLDENENMEKIFEVFETFNSKEEAVGSYKIIFITPSNEIYPSNNLHLALS